MIRIMNVVALALTVSFSYGLYKIKYDTRIAERRVMLLRQDIETQKETLKVLHAEWSHLNQPEKIQSLAEKYLDLNSIELKQIVHLSDVPMRSYVAREEGRDRLMAEEDRPAGEERTHREGAPLPLSALMPRPKPLDLTRGGDANG